MGKSKFRQCEPMVKANEALIIPKVGIAYCKGVINKLVEFIEERSGKVHYHRPVRSVNQTAVGNITIQAAINTHTYNRLVFYISLHYDLASIGVTGKKVPCAQFFQ